MSNLMTEIDQRTGLAGANKMACPALHVNQAASEFRAHPITDVACDMNFAARHFAADVSASVAVNVDSA